MAPKRKRKPAAKSTKEVHGGSSSTPKDQVILRSGTKVSKKPILVPRRPRRKRRGATVAQPDPATETKPPYILPVATNPLPSPVDSYTRKCNACGASKPCTDSNSEFPTHAELPACQHKSHKTCRPCLTEHIAKVWSHLGLKKLTCPDCPAPIQLRSVENFCGPQIRERYLSLAGADCAEVYPNWRWCLYPPCSAGQTHLSSSGPIVMCEQCGFKTCFDHRVPWHEEYTCAEFDNKQAVDIERSERHMRCSMARCPRCGRGVEQNGGSDNMVCPCGAHWKCVGGAEELEN